MFFKKKINEDNESNEYWMSYSDMLAAVILIFILIITCSIKNYNDNSEKLVVSRNKIIEKEEEIKRLVGIKQSLILQIKESFKNTDIKINIDNETGDITMDSNVLFDFDSFKITAKGKKLLNKFMNIYLNVLLNEKNYPFISEITIEGHTDSIGTYLNNLELSQKRALEVSKFIYSSNDIVKDKKKKDVLKDVLTAKGRSFSNLIYKKDGSVDNDKSRRVEFKFRLKDTEMIETIKDMINGES